jgi:hypothetical protein
MPLLDHFRPPLSEQRHWHSFHNSWATYLSSQLNSVLPAGFFAEANVQFGIEIDVAAVEHRGATWMPKSHWSPPPPQATLPVELSGSRVEINIFRRSGGPQLAGAIELVSPANKDRPAHREALVSKCASYLNAGVGLVLVDVVTERSWDFHRDLLARLGSEIPESDSLFASAYRPVEHEGKQSLDVWYEPLELGRELPTLPLWLRGGYCLPVELESTYERTCSEQRLRIVVEAA